MSTDRKPASAVVGVVILIAWWGLGGVVVVAASNFIFGRARLALWEGAVLGVVLGLATWLGLYLKQRGWSLPLLPDRSELKRRRQKLAEDRERILRSATER